MNDPIQHLRDASWRRQRTPAQDAELRAWLEAHPEARLEWEAEEALNRALDRLPEVPVSTNFTARVLQAVELERAAAGRSSASQWKWLWRVLPRASLAGVFVFMSVKAYREARFQKSERLAKSVEMVAQMAALPSPDVLRDFDAIQSLASSPPPDAEWLALLQ